MQRATLWLSDMALPVMEFKVQGYKITNIFAQISTYTQGNYQNDCLNLSYVKDIYVVPPKKTTNGRKNLKANLIPAYFGVAPSIVYQGPDLIYICFTDRGPLNQAC